MRWVDFAWIERYYFFPRSLVISQIFNPDDVALYAWKSIHGGVSAKKNVVLKERNVICRVAGSLDDLNRQI